MNVKLSPTKDGSSTRNSHHEGDYELGIPPSRMEIVKVLSEEEFDKRKQYDDLQRECKEKSRLSDTPDDSSSLLDSIGRFPLFVAFVVILFGVIRTLPEPTNWIVGVIGVIVFAMVFVWLLLRKALRPFIRCAKIWRWLRRS